jgi:D-arabinose 1-dehydrogenase-like Zn-dependent alcohol dehydrogenase
MVSLEMPASVFPSSLACGAVLIAVWIDLRFAQRRPDSPVRRLGHGLVAFLVVQLALAAGFHVVGSDPSAGQRVLVFLALILPAWTYAFLAALWTLRTLAQLRGG